MSRIGKLPVIIPDGTSVSVSSDNIVTVKGPKGELSQKVDRDIVVEVNEKEIILKRPTDQKRHRSLHGLYRALINNMITGVSKGFTIQQELVALMASSRMSSGNR